MTNHAARLPLSIGPEAGRIVVCFACALAVASLGAPPRALAAQMLSRAPLTSPGAAPASPGAALPPQGSVPSPQGSAQAPSAPPAMSQEGGVEKRRIERATALHDQAQGLYQHGEYRAAIARLEAAVALDPEGKELIYNLAVIHERLGEIEQAERYYRRYLEMEALPKEREEVAAVLKRLQGAKRELSSAKPPPAPAPSAQASAALPYLPRLPRRSAAGGVKPHGPWLYVSGGIAAGSLVVGGVFAALAVARDPGSSKRTGGGVSVADLQADASAAHRCAVAADVALLIAGLSGAAALYLYLSPRAPAASPRVARPASAALSGAAIPGRDDGPPSHGARTAEEAPRVGLSLGAGGARLRVQF